MARIRGERTLLDLSESEEAIVEHIVGGRGLTRRLISLGLVPGARIKVIRKGVVGGPVLLRIGRSEVAIGRGVATKVYVTPIGRR